MISRSRIRRLLLVSFYILIFPQHRAQSAGVNILSPNLALCLYETTYFDLILELENSYVPYNSQHVAESLLFSSISNVIIELNECKDRKILVVSPEGT